MKTRKILDTLLRANVHLEHCGIIEVIEEMRFDDFVRHYFYSDFDEHNEQYHRYLVPEGEYFYCYFGGELFFGMDEIYTTLYLEDTFLHIIPLEDEENGED